MERLNIVNRPGVMPVITGIICSVLMVVAMGCGEIEMVSVESDGRQISGYSQYPAISGNGRFVVFSSYYYTREGDEFYNPQDIFLYDRLTKTIEPMSVSPNGGASMGCEFDPVSICSGISADGQFVVFLSSAFNLVTNDNNANSDVFFRDRESDVTERMNIASNGEETNQWTETPAMSPDGQFVAFSSASYNLVPNDNNYREDIFIRDRQKGITELVSVAWNGGGANDYSLYCAINTGGRFVAFMSHASNLVQNDHNGVGDIFVRDRVAGATERVNIASDGNEANNGSSCPAISADGRFVVYSSDASNLVQNDFNAESDIFVRDRIAGFTKRVSVASDGSEADSFSSRPAISADGRFVVFSSDASNLVQYDYNGESDIFVRDRKNGITERISVSATGDEANGESEYPAISADGRFIAFHSLATNLVPDDTNESSDIFVAPNPLFTYFNLND